MMTSFSWFVNEAYSSQEYSDIYELLLSHRSLLLVLFLFRIDKLA